jgi:hypothetical protein
MPQVKPISKTNYQLPNPKFQTVIKSQQLNNKSKTNYQITSLSSLTMREQHQDCFVAFTPRNDDHFIIAKNIRFRLEQLVFGIVFLYLFGNWNLVIGI